MEVVSPPPSAEEENLPKSQAIHVPGRFLNVVCVCQALFRRVSACRGTELSDATLSNEAVHQRGKHPLAMDVYLLQRLNKLSN